MFNAIFFIGLLILFAICGWFFFIKKGFANFNQQQLDKHTLLQSIEKVFKIVLAEGHFTEIVDFKDKNKQLFGLMSSTKKSLIVVDAKVLIGFDFKKAVIDIDEKNTKIVLPVPEILSIETNYNFYDIKNGWLNKFDTHDYTNLLAHAKEEIKQKALSSNLITVAKAQLELLIKEITARTAYKDIKTNFYIPNIASISLLENKQ